MGGCLGGGAATSRKVLNQDWLEIFGSAMPSEVPLSSRYIDPPSRNASGGRCLHHPAEVLVGYFLSRPFEDHVVSGETPHLPTARRLVGCSLVDLPPSSFELHDSPSGKSDA